MCYSLLQCAIVCCSVLQRATVCCSMWQLFSEPSQNNFVNHLCERVFDVCRVAGTAWCGVLQCVTVCNCRGFRILGMFYMYKYLCIHLS